MIDGLTFPLLGAKVLQLLGSDLVPKKKKARTNNAPQDAGNPVASPHTGDS